MRKEKKGFVLYLDGIDTDRSVMDEIFCEEADQLLEQEVWNKNFALANETLKWMLLDKVTWLNDVFIESFQSKYKDVSISKLDEVSLLMKEAMSSYDEVAIYDIFHAAVLAEFGSFNSMVYLLDKAIFYCNGYFYPYKIFAHLEVKARYSNEYCLLANNLARLFTKHHVIVNPDAVKRLLDSAREKMCSDYEKLSLAFSYQIHGYPKEAEEILYPTVEYILDKIKSGGKEYQVVKSLIEDLDKVYDFESDDMCFTWKLELSNRLYGVFYENRD